MLSKLVGSGELGAMLSGPSLIRVKLIIKTRSTHSEKKLANFYNVSLLPLVSTTPTGGQNAFISLKRPVWLGIVILGPFFVSTLAVIPAVLLMCH